ncbi:MULTISPECIES: hypothetical protein [Mycolicibacterium]|uniref:Uncharacterized protein n=1 Tax=Mycolicibacterium senegalense TaxID=1796 RepID=A0A378SXC6_9MYCO|nr:MULTISPECIES: hypothetical protein [Mycolicibacterium]MCV7333898.1 hypothetical protein [Mycolicibacterium senegalense]MDR7292465.1 hypothetical protein [Mycolicibacterium senegalense]QZA23829.1 hypothetical protein K3U95_24765 [Mycolicibacterium senegalense]CDP88316.1 hypothetical protein BN975_04150 [Mycolicibacterium farcinogenes]STZ51658.1 Uncharacterised protein [Mycolicibacterium senegalense]
MTDAVRWEADGDDPALSDREPELFEWIELDVPAENWWEIIDHPEVAERGPHGWNYHSCTPSPQGEDRVVLTYYRPFNVPAVHTRGLSDRLGRGASRGGRSARGFCR